jgi:hypothetical protein
VKVTLTLSKGDIGAAIASEVERRGFKLAGAIRFAVAEERDARGEPTGDSKIDASVDIEDADARS